MRRLLNESVLEHIIAAACDRMKACSCDTSCYNCLRSYYNQHWHEQLDRHKAYNFLNNYLGKIEKIEKLKPEGLEEIHFIDDGLSVKTESYQFIFSQLDELDKEKQALLIDVFSNGNFEKPDYNAIGFEVSEKKDMPIWHGLKRKFYSFVKITKKAIALQKPQIVPAYC